MRLILTLGGGRCGKMSQKLTWSYYGAGPTLAQLLVKSGSPTSATSNHPRCQRLKLSGLMPEINVSLLLLTYTIKRKSESDS